MFQDYQQRLNELVNSDALPERKDLETLPNYDPIYMKEGYLQKKGQRLKGWKRRWFVCDGRTLSYYISRKDRKPNAIIPLEGCTVQDGGISETWNSPRIYLTDGTSGVMYCLSAEEGEIVTEWLHVLRNAVAKLSASTSAGSNNEKMKRTTGVDSGMDSTTTTALTRTTLLTSNTGTNGGGERRGSRIVSTASVGGGGTNANRVLKMSRTDPVVATNIKLENELSQGLHVLESLLYNRISARSHVLFRPLGATSNGVLQSVGRHTITGKQYARASAVLPLQLEMVAHIIKDHIKRAEWDLHFPRSSHVATLDEATYLIHLSGDFVQLSTTKTITSTEIAAGIGALVGALWSSSWDTMWTNILVAAIIGVMLNSFNYASMVAPRDLLLLRHVREMSSFGKQMSPTSDVLDADHGVDQDNGILMILEKSVVNEHKPVSSGVVRAHVGLSGWLLEAVDQNRTLATYVTDIDLKGWLSDAAKHSFLLQRLECVNVLVEYATQANLCGNDFGFTDDQESRDGAFGEHVQCEGSQNINASLSNPSGEFHPRSYLNGMVQLPSGGLKLIDKEIVKKQGGVLKDVLKSAGSKILEGKGLVGLSLPVRIFEPRTNLERLVDLFLFAPTFLTKAAELSSDPLERFKNVITFAFAGLHHGVGQLKPFNPILGETFQAALDDGTEVFCEHTSHHPPISNFQLVGKQYSVSGFLLFDFSVSIKSNAFIQMTKGPIRVSFDDGTIISYNLPCIQCSGGVLWGDRIVELCNSMVFEDPMHNLSCEMKFNPDGKKGMGGMFSTAKTPSDYVRGVILNTTTNAEIMEVTGSWLHTLRFGDVEYWNFKKNKSGNTIQLDEKLVLPSDSRYREDRQYLALNDLEKAQDWKVKLEVLQRADRKIRNEGRRSNHWTLKDDKSGHH